VSFFIENAGIIIRKRISDWK